MTSSKRLRSIRIAGVISCLAVVAGVTTVALARAPSSAHASSDGEVSFSGTRATQAQITFLGATHPTSLLGAGAITQAPTQATPAHTTVLTPRTAHLGQGPMKANPAAPTVAPSADTSTDTAAGLGAGPAHPNFNGLSDLDNANSNGFELEPPDTTTCVGFDPFLPGRPEVVFEVVSEVVAEYRTDGTLIAKTAEANFYGTPDVLGHNRCEYDPGAHSFYFTDLNSTLLTGTGNTNGVDLLQLDTITGARHEYFFDFTDPTNSGCLCFGDQPRVGYDDGAIYLGSEEFPTTGPGTFNQFFNGTEAYAISKQDVLNGAASPTAWFFHNLEAGGIPVFGLDPAQSWSGSGTEWLLNSFPFDAQGNNNVTDDVVALWRSTGDNHIEAAAPVLHVKLIPTETYAFPVDAVSTAGTSNALNADDDRITELEFLNGHLYTAFTSALNVPHDSITYDGAAWLDISTTTGAVSAQGYVVFKNTYLIDPAMWRSPDGQADIAFTETNSRLNPSAAFSSRPNDNATFSAPHITALGASPYVDVFFRWGDYSWAAPDPVNGDIWMAAEDIPPVADQAPDINWGTEVFRD